VTAWEAAAPLLAHHGVRDPVALAAEREQAERDQREAEEERRRAAAITPEQIEDNAVRACLDSLRKVRASSHQDLAAWEWRRRVAEVEGHGAVRAADRQCPMGLGYCAVWWWRRAHEHGLVTLRDLQRVAEQR
jgi:hypothetical protein